MIRVPPPPFSRVRHLLVPALVCAALGLSTRAEARPEFPSIVRETLDMPCSPQCTVCHRDSKGGNATAIKPIVFPLENSFGFDADESSSLGAALLEMEREEERVFGAGDAGTADAGDAGAAPACTPEPAAGACRGMRVLTDSDCDCIPNTAELRSGTDPNVFGAVSVCVDGPTYGCFARVEPESRLNGYAAALGAIGLLGLVAARRHSRRSAK